MKKNLVLEFCALAVLLMAAVAPPVPGGIPVTGAVSTSVESGVVSSARPLAARILDPGVFSLKILQQPADDPGFVSRKEDSVTQFRLASNYGSKGFLAHNDLAGASFFKVEVGDILTVSYTDGSADTFQVAQVRHLQAVTPNSPYSSFVDLDDNDASLTAVDLFYQTYGVKGTLVLQTCIANGAELSWGRLFIIAEPVRIIPNAQ